MDKDQALEKIKKCLNLSKSSNPNESAIALKQMRKIMQEYNIGMGEVQESIIRQANSYIGGRLVLWKQKLAKIVAEAFDCCFCWGGDDKSIKFFGIESNAEIALYAYETLVSQLDRDRKKYMKENHKDQSRANRNKISNTYCFGWLKKIQSAVENIVPKKEEKELIEKYMDKKIDIEYSKGSVFTIVGGDIGSDAMENGKKDGSKANLFHATYGKEQELIG